MIKSIEDLKRNLIVKADLQLDINKNSIIQRFAVVTRIFSYCYGFIDCYCELNDCIDYVDDLKRFITNYVIDSIKCLNEEEKDKNE